MKSVRNCALQITWPNKEVAPDITLRVMAGYRVKRKTPLTNADVFLPEDYSAYIYLLVYTQIFFFPSTK